MVPVQEMTGLASARLRDGCWSAVGELRVQASGCSTWITDAGASEGRGCRDESIHRPAQAW